MDMGTDFEKATQFGELYKAAYQCFRNIRWKESTQEYQRNVLPRTYALRQDLINGTYKIQPYYIFYIHTPKKRQIVSTRLRDRIWQRSMCNNGLYDDLTRGFIHDNCACQTGRGTHYAMARLECHMQRIWRKHGPAVWVAKLDISKFFPSIPHIVAKAAAAKRIRDEHFRQHVFDIIDSFKDERPQAEIDADPFGPRGIALGSQISQLVALAVLDDIDHYIKERLHIRHYVRYMDDLVLIHEDKGVLMSAMLTIQALLARLGLKLNPKSCIYPASQGIVFLKLRFMFTRGGGIIRRVVHEAISKERQRLKAMKRLLDSGCLTAQDINLHFKTWMANKRHANARGVVRAMREYGKRLFQGDNANGVQDAGTSQTGDVGCADACAENA